MVTGKMMLHVATWLCLAIASTRAELPYQASDDAAVEVFSNSTDFRRRVLESDSVWVIQFYAPWCGHCKAFEARWVEAAKILKGIIHVGAVDASSDGPQKRIAESYGVTGFPTIKIFGADKAKPVDYRGERDVGHLIQAVLSDGVVKLIESRTEAFRINTNAQSGEAGGGGGGGGGGSGGKQKTKVKKITAANFKERILDPPEVALVAFIAPWCGHCKKLLPEWSAASLRLEGEGITVAIVDATEEQELASQFDVRGYPTIKVFPGGANKTPADARDYEGGREEADIVREALAELDRSGVPQEIPELTSAQQFDESCNGPNRICILVALPHILESGAAGRNKYRDTLALIAKNFRGTAFTFFWFEGGNAQSELENALELTFGFPAVAAVSVGKGVYTVHRGSFSDRNVGKFLTAIQMGKQATTKLAKVPTIVDVEPWDGLDGTPIEEEPLEDIMGWDDEM